MSYPVMSNTPRNKAEGEGRAIACRRLLSYHDKEHPDEVAYGTRMLEFAQNFSEVQEWEDA